MESINNKNLTYLFMVARARKTEGAYSENRTNPRIDSISLQKENVACRKCRIKKKKDKCIMINVKCSSEVKVFLWTFFNSSYSFPYIIITSVFQMEKDRKKNCTKNKRRPIHSQQTSSRTHTNAFDKSFCTR